MKFLKHLFCCVLTVVLVLSAVPKVNCFAAVDERSQPVSLGVDVSSWNGTVNWATAAMQIDFAVLRIGRRLTVDSRFAENAAGCQASGIPYGVYYVSSAATVEDALSEADFVIQTLEGRELGLPVFLDVEYDGDHQTYFGGVMHGTTNGCQRKILQCNQASWKG